jgi:hypothetical protein
MINQRRQAPIDIPYTKALIVEAIEEELNDPDGSSLNDIQTFVEENSLGRYLKNT